MTEAAGAGRNEEMARRIEAAPVRYPLTFVVAGDSGAWFDPTADAIFTQLVEQTMRLDPRPVFFAHLGDFAGPGTVDRHEHYLRIVERLPIPDICLVGNHDLDHPSAAEAWSRIHGPTNFSFAYGDTRFVALNAAPGVVGEVSIDEPPEGVEGPRPETLAFLDDTLRLASEPHRVVLMHMPPFMNGHYAPHANWGFRRGEREFFTLLADHRVRLVCCAHGLAFDEHVHNGVRIVMSGGGGSGLCSHRRGICTTGDDRPEDRGALFHAVAITMGADGRVAGRVIQAFAADPADARMSFGD
jgi:hypothetical protein